MKKKSRQRCAVNLGRWFSYAAAGAATAGLAANDVEAGIFYSGVLNQSVGMAQHVSTVFIKTLAANSVQGVNILGSVAHQNAGRLRTLTATEPARPSGSIASK